MHWDMYWEMCSKPGSRRVVLPAIAGGLVDARTRFVAAISHTQACGPGSPEFSKSYSDMASKLSTFPFTKNGNAFLVRACPVPVLGERSAAQSLSSALRCCPHAWGRKEWIMQRPRLQYYGGVASCCDTVQMVGIITPHA